MVIIVVSHAVQSTINNSIYTYFILLIVFFHLHKPKHTSVQKDGSLASSPQSQAGYIIC